MRRIETKLFSQAGDHKRVSLSQHVLVDGAKGYVCNLGTKYIHVSIYGTGRTLRVSPFAATVELLMTEHL